MIDQQTNIQEKSKVVNTTPVDRLISNAHLAASQGNWELAHQQSSEATRIYPDNVDAWLTRARYARNADERIFSLSQAHRLDPRHPVARQESYDTIWSMLQKDPYLAYEHETDDLYYVRSNEYTSLALPKDRAAPETYPSREPSELTPAYRWLGITLIGMLFAGLGGLIFGPVAIYEVLSAERKPLDRADRIRSRVILIISLILMVISLLMGLLFYNHLRG